MKIKRIIITLVLCIVTFIGSYYVTLIIDKGKDKGDVKITVTFDDTENYTIPSIKKMDKETALKEWPYIMTIENNADGKGIYQIIIEDEEESNIKRNKLNYALYLDEEEVSSDNLDKIKDNILYTYEIEGNKTQKYRLYIWVSSDIEEDENLEYTYHLNLNAIKTGGPGF